MDLLKPSSTAYADVHCHGDLGSTHQGWLRLGKLMNNFYKDIVFFPGRNRHFEISISAGATNIFYVVRPRIHVLVRPTAIRVGEEV